MDGRQRLDAPVNRSKPHFISVGWDCADRNMRKMVSEGRGVRRPLAHVQPAVVLNAVVNVLTSRRTSS